MLNDVGKLKLELEQAVDERNEAWFQLEDAGVEIQPVREE
ncbi:hypothetical protein ALT761_00940 [Alteromonas sp. 76-1]|nr:hypothetical protein ALT761_00940 [Alteromonas sp. 76-1]